MVEKLDLILTINTFNVLHLLIYISLILRHLCLKYCEMYFFVPFAEIVLCYKYERNKGVLEETKQT